MGTVREGRSVFPLRPLGMSEILDAAVTTMRTYPRPSLGTSAVLYGGLTVLVTMIGAAITLLVVAGDNPVAQAVAVVLGGIGFTVLYAVSSLGRLATTAAFASIMSGLVAHAVLGRPATLRRVWSETSRSFGWLVLYALIVGTASVPFVIASAFLGNVLSLGRSGVYLYVAGMLALGVVALWLGAQFWLAPAVIVIEGVHVIKGLGRSWQLNANGRWRATGLLALTGVLCVLLWVACTAGLFSVVALLYSMVGTLTGGSAAGIIALATTVAGGLLVGAIATPFLGAVPGVAYLDRRMRLEGFDLVLGELRAAGRLTAPPDGGCPVGPATPFAAPGDRRPPAWLRRRPLPRPGYGPAYGLPYGPPYGPYASSGPAGPYPRPPAPPYPQAPAPPFPQPYPQPPAPVPPPAIRTGV